MGNRKIQKSIQSLRRTIQVHRAKIAAENRRSNVKAGLIRHWESEIRALTTRLHHLEARLARRRRRGR